MLMVLLAACSLFGTGPGKPCEATGSGFTRRDPCREKCVGWEVTCADGQRVVPGVCSGGPCASDAECADGFGCVKVDATDAHCLPRQVCPEGFAG